MSNLEIAYNSLNEAKAEEETLKNKNDKLGELYNFIVLYCKENTGFSNVDEELLKQTQNLNLAWKFILLVFLVFGGVYGIIDLIAVYFLNRPSFVYSSIGAGIVSCTFAIRENIKDIIEAKKNIKQLKNIRELLQDEREYRNKPLKELLHLLGKKSLELDDILKNKRKMIAEYESMLAKENEKLAEEIMLESGIPASITLDSSVKVLAKRYNG